ncbi:MAG: hypothetical protein ACQER9_02795 [Nanobdellota archaeon]
MKKVKKANISQSFVYISAIIIMGVILLLGGSAVNNIISNMNRLEKADFRNDFKESINEVRGKYGSRRIFNLTGLKDYDELCVFDLDSYDINNDNTHESYDFMGLELEKGTSNVFLVKNDAVEESFLIKDIEVDRGSICQEISESGIIGIRIEGLGRKVEFDFT